jgi:PHP family Zn ribbon phosphoesterase
MALDVKSVYSAKVQKIWNELIRGRSEIEVLVEADLSELPGEERVIDAIRAFRSKDVVVEPGGGGKYGRVKLPDRLSSTKNDDQRSLFDF